MFLRQSTASQEIKLGAFLDSTDGNTQETGLTIANTDIKLTKGGATTETNKNSGGATHVAGGRYSAVLNATDTNTLGNLEIDVHVAGALAVHRTYVVLPAQVFDSIVLGTDLLDVNSAQISGGAAAADNLEANFDGTGYTDSTAPSTQAQISGIANVGSAVHKAAASYTLTTGTQSSGTFTSTQALDGVTHDNTDSGGAIDLYYEFTIGGGSPSSAQVTGRVNGGNDDIDVYGFDWVASAWVQIGNIDGTNGSTNSVDSFDMFVDMVGSGANEGLVRVRFFKASGLTSATLRVDQIFVAFSQGVEGYDNGAVWFNSNSSNTGTEVNIDGTARNPVSTHAALMTLLTSTGLHKVEMTPGSSMTLGAAMEGFTINGNGGVLEQGSQDVGGTVFRSFGNISGVATTTGDSCFYEDCIFGIATVPPSVHQQCGYGSTLTQGGTGDYTFVDCYSIVAGSGSPVFTISAAGVATVEYRRWSGGLMQSGMQSGDIATIGGEMGTVTLNGSDGTAEIRGTYKAITDNRTGSPTLNTDGAIKGVDVADIKVTTDQFVFTIPNEVDSNAISGGGSGLNAQQTRDAMKLAPTAGSPAAGSVDAHLDTIEEDTNDLQTNQGNWLTATGFSTFNPATDTVANVTNVANNADMRGTDGANTVVPDNTSTTAIKTKTDQLTFTKANELDSNVQSVNDTTVNGDGTLGNEWGP